MRRAVCKTVGKSYCDPNDKTALGLYKPKIENCQSVINVDLSGTDVQYVPDRYFFDVPNLQNLALARNSIRSIPTIMLEKNGELTMLDLSHNKIEFIQSGLFNKNPKLSELYLSNNIISKMDITAFKNLKESPLIDGGRQRDRRSTKPTSSLKTLHLYGNLLEPELEKELAAVYNYISDIHVKDPPTFRKIAKID